MAAGARMTVETWLAEQPELAEHLLFQTSGSTGSPKHVCLSKEALRASATMVNAHLESDANDVWLSALPRHHIGGHSIHERAILSGARVVSTEGKWDPLAFCELADQEGATLSALVPTQVYDLVSGNHRAPHSMRAILVGGGALAHDLAERAQALGWPLLQTYGMTETASQVATQALGSGPEDAMQLLSGWQTDVNAEGYLRLQGAPLFSGYVVAEDESFRFIRQEGWFTTADRVTLKGRDLTFIGRATDRLKIKGELANLSNLRADLEAAARACGYSPTSSTLVAVSDPRDGQALMLVCPEGERETLLQALVARTPRLFHPRRSVSLGMLPRTPLGKLDEQALADLLETLTPKDC